MKTFLYFKLFFLVLFLLPKEVWAYQNPVFVASAPEYVEFGSQFRLTLAVISSEKLQSDEIQNFREPPLRDFEVLMGPVRSTATTGKVTMPTYQYSYTYVLKAFETGKFVIPSTSLVVKGKLLRTQELTIHVVPEGKLPSSSGVSVEPKSETFITMNVSNRSPRVNSPVVLECKLYTTAQVDSLANLQQQILLKDFKVKPVSLREKKWKLETRNGKEYQTIVFRQLLLYPLHEGKLRIGNLSVDAYVRQTDGSKVMDPMEEFFRGNRNADQRVRQRLSCPEITLNVSGASSAFTSVQGHGLYGNVRTVTTGKVTLSFDKNGNMVSDGANRYIYRGANRYMIDNVIGPFRITCEGNLRKEVDEKGIEGTIEYEFDSRGRVVRYKFFDGMMPVERTYTYEGTGKYPCTMESSASYEDGVDVEICRYTYLETDSRGNWTKRRVKRTWEITMYYPENGADRVSTKTEPEFIETRTISYF